MSADEQAMAGCEAFGHLVSPWVDGELSGDDRQRLEAHVPACRPCQKLAQDYRALDLAARGPVPAVTDAQWERAWSAIAARVREDREAAERAPLAPVVRMVARWSGGPRRRWVAPLGYAAAASLLLALALAVQRGAGGEGPPPGVASARRQPESVVAAATPSASIECAEPEFIPIVTTIDGDEPLHIVQCLWIGEG